MDCLRSTRDLPCHCNLRLLDQVALNFYICSQKVKSRARADRLQPWIEYLLLIVSGIWISGRSLDFALFLARSWSWQCRSSWYCFYTLKECKSLPLICASVWFWCNDLLQAWGRLRWWMLVEWMRLEGLICRGAREIVEECMQYWMPVVRQYIVYCSVILLQASFLTPLVKEGWASWNCSFEST